MNSMFPWHSRSPNYILFVSKGESEDSIVSLSQMLTLDTNRKTLLGRLQTPVSGLLMIMSWSEPTNEVLGTALVDWIR